GCTSAPPTRSRPPRKRSSKARRNPATSLRRAGAGFFRAHALPFPPDREDQMDRRSFIIGTAAAVAARPALGQETYPSHPITSINAFPPGGANDIVTRPLATAMEPILKQPVVVETKAGAGGQVGAQVVASAKPDGYTLLTHNTGISGYAEVDKLFDRPPKATRADFITLARVVADPVVLLVNDQQPWKTLKEFVDDA